ncbi:retropepsin-like aspartic protease [Mucilaginibacter aquaedulcis]|uniref:retropepsin-like aspartic protease n=1 Tax=Mucilaginibacter aquaedulcis TaxID=1187081 RepID=UPI0025B44D92|nr:retropepsin-like aspartic protease [Mucilaginibacter aquaedulcis]MDN3550114.1 retropepsin-like aspartic protease [Mucilaginibacter aquaedulcis]
MLITGVSHAQSSIPFELTPQGHIVVKAKINGIEGNFIFDTGAGLTLITKTFSDKIGKLHKQDGSYTAFRATGEKLTADLYDAQTVTLGTFVEHNPVLTIFDANLGPIDGLISLMSFKEQPLTIDYINKKIIFETDKSLFGIRKSGHQIPLQLEESRDKALTIFTYFTVNNKLTLQFCIDCGAGANVYRINSRYIPALGIDTANASKITIPSEFDPKVKTIIYNANIKSITAKASPDIQCQDVKASFINGLIYDGIVSLNWIGKRVTFDLKKHEMIVNNY